MLFLPKFKTKKKKKKEAWSLILRKLTKHLFRIDFKNTLYKKIIYVSDLFCFLSMFL